jgi:glucoamylase
MGRGAETSEEPDRADAGTSGSGGGGSVAAAPRRTALSRLRIRLTWLAVAVLAVVAVLRWGQNYSPTPAWSVRDAATRYTPNQLADARLWLTYGSVPAASTRWADMAGQALLDIRALTKPNGATIAANYGPWRNVWPRDAAWVAAAFCVTGHQAEAASVLGFLAQTQHDDGTWSARYHLHGEPVRERRKPQLDATGWVPWAVGLCAGQPDGPAVPGLWPMVRGAADAAARSFGRDGLPGKSPDYWEKGSAVTLGTAAPLLAGLRIATELAGRLGYPADADRWSAAADRLAAAVDASFGATGYQRQPKRGSGADAAVAFLAPPFAPFDTATEAVVRDTAARLAVPNGGIRPGEKWGGDPNEAWTPETALFALAFAASGDPADRIEAERLLDWLDQHRTTTGSLPERVSRFDHPVSVAPLGWTAAITLLALAAYDGTLSTNREMPAGQ